MTNQIPGNGGPGLDSSLLIEKVIELVNLCVCACAYMCRRRWLDVRNGQEKCWGRLVGQLTLPPAAAAKSLQSCPTLCDPIDRSPPGSSVHGIFQARVLEWVAIAFSNTAP